MGKLFSFPPDHFMLKKRRPLTTLMITTLKLACNKQHNNISFGPKDLKGAVMPLIQRGLISSHMIRIRGHLQLTWYVTRQGMDLLTTVNGKYRC
ncbi:MAG: hypothetical protein ABJA57_07540 [Ginsengibacter sp.]